MKKLLFLFSAGLFAMSSTAQDLPMPSPTGNLEQTVGLTQVKIEYSRPSAKGRKIFGELVAYDEVWRFGANACTKLTTNTTLNFSGQLVEAGTYSLFATPSEKGMWIIAINKDIEQSGTGSYDTKKNVASIKITPQAINFTETFTLDIANVTFNSASIEMRWENVSISVPFTVETEKIAEQNIADAIKKGEELEKVYYKAAAYLYRSLNDERKAMQLIEQGLAVKETYSLHFLKAQILHDKGDNKEAIASAETAHKLALEADAKGYADYIKSTMDSWK